MYRYSLWLTPIKNFSVICELEENTSENMEFNTTNNETFERIQWEPKVKSIWFILFLITAILGIIGNGIVAWIVLAHRSMKTNTNVYIGKQLI